MRVLSPIVIACTACIVCTLGIVGVSPATVAAQGSGGGKAMFIPAPSLPGPLRRAVPRVIARGSRLLPREAYVRAAEGRSLAPASGPAIRRFGVRQGAHVIVVAGFGARGRDKLLRLRYYHGGTGEEISSRTHHLRGVHIDPATQRAILRDLSAAISRGRGGGRRRVAGRASAQPEPSAARSPGVTRSRREESAGRSRTSLRRFAPPPEAPAAAEPTREGADGLPPPVDWDEEGADAPEAEPEAAPEQSRRRRRRAPEPVYEDEPEYEDDAEEELEDDDVAEDGDVTASERAYMARQWGFDVSAGFGFGQRTAAVPMEAGEGRFASSPFPAVAAGLDAWVRPSADSSLRLGFGARYYTSVGLEAQDQRADGTTRSVGTRAQDLQIGLHLNLPLADSARAVRLDLEGGWGFRMLDSDLPLSMPTYSLSGPYARAGLFFPIGEEGPLVLGVVPEIGHVSSVSEEVAVAGQVSDGFSVGIEAQVRVNLIPELDLDLVYRESHAFLSSERETDMKDVSRFGVLRVTYRP